MVDIGKEIFEGKGLCITCHTIGPSGALRFPDLAGIATRAAERVPGLDALTYMAESLYRAGGLHRARLRPGMPAIDKPPIALSDDEIKAVIAYLQTLGGEATITMATVLPTRRAPSRPRTSTRRPRRPPPRRPPPRRSPPPPKPGAIGTGGEELLARYGCTACHAGQPGGAKKLDGVGSRLDRAADPALADRPRPPPLPPTYGDRVTLAEVEAMTELPRRVEGGGMRLWLFALVALALVAVGRLPRLSRGRVRLNPLAWIAAWAVGLWLVLSFGFAPPVPKSVVQLYLGIVAPGAAALRQLRPRARRRRDGRSSPSSPSGASALPRRGDRPHPGAGRHRDVDGR
jgi:mono/diheme cytochrome c family protein